jgi:hypothetical protein
MSTRRLPTAESTRPSTERALRSLLVIFGGGLAVMLVCALLEVGAASVPLGLLTMLVVWRAIR